MIQTFDPKWIKDEIYRFRNNNHYSVFAVTSAGIIATDPMVAEGRIPTPQ